MFTTSVRVIFLDMTFVQLVLILLFVAILNTCSTTQLVFTPTIENPDPLEERYGKLLHASVIFRHGDRTPVTTYPLDPYKNYNWPQKYGQLTNNGKRRLYNLGKWFKMRYNNLTGNTYSRQHILVNSSGIDRTIMSAQCFLFGYYPADGYELWYDAHEKWQPIPVFEIPPMYDNMILMSRTCPRLQQLKEKDNPNMREVCKKNEEILKYISENSGLNISCADDGKYDHQLTNLFDTLFVEKENNLTLPKWTSKIYPEYLKNITQDLSSRRSSSVELWRLSAGPLLKSIITDINKKVNNGSNFTQTLHVYSGHDTTIETITRALQIYNNIKPPYGTALMFELRKRNNTEFHLTISYKNTTDKVYLLEMPKYGTGYSLDQFINATKHLIPDDWEQECAKTKTISFATRTISNNCLILIIAVLFTLFQ